LAAGVIDFGPELGELENYWEQHPTAPKKVDETKKWLDGLLVEDALHRCPQELASGVLQLLREHDMTETQLATNGRKRPRNGQVYLSLFPEERWERKLQEYLQPGSRGNDSSSDIIVSDQFVRDYSDVFQERHWSCFKCRDTKKGIELISCACGAGQSCDEHSFELPCQNGHSRFGCVPNKFRQLPATPMLDAVAFMDTELDFGVRAISYPDFVRNFATRWG
jgi:hypothetical protein